MSKVIKRKAQNELCLEKKVELLKFLDDGNCERKAAVEFNVGKGTVSAIKKRKEEYLRMFAEEKIVAERRRKIRKTENNQINEFTWAWLQRLKAMDCPVSGRMIQLTAKTFGDKIGNKKFRASNGWLESFKKAHNVDQQRTICSELAEVGLNNTDKSFTDTIPQLCDGYKPSDIFNAVETSLLYRALPGKSWTINRDTSTSHERLSVLLAASATGEKLRPLVIGNSAKPRCFYGIDNSNLAVIYRSNRRVWMDSQLFTEWLQDLNNSFQIQKRNVLLFIENCPAHVDMVLSNVKLRFLPSSKTASFSLQPLERGATRAFKVSYRKELLKAVIGRNDVLQTSTSSPDQVRKSVTVLDAVYWIDKAWKQVKPVTIRKCFKETGFPVAKSKDGGSEPDNEVTLQQLIAQACSMLQLGDVPPEDVYADLDSGIENQICENPAESSSPAIEDSSDDDSEKVELPTAKEATEFLRKFKFYVITCMPHLADKIHDIESEYNGAVVNFLLKMNILRKEFNLPLT